MYHIFSVYDYKGGELLSTINLDRESLISRLAEIYYLDDYLTDMEELARYEFFRQHIEDNSSTYAGRGDVVMEIYESSEDGKLIEVDVYDLVPEIVDYIVAWENENREFLEETVDNE